MVRRCRHHYWKTGINSRLMGNGKLEEEPRSVVCLCVKSSAQKTAKLCAK